ncbi:DUF3810 domain-containing protein [Alkaliphilus crotonatoxidans]
MSHSLTEKIKSKRKLFLPILPIIALGCFLLSKILKGQGWLLEKYYSLGINKWLLQGISQITGMFPFSLGEIVYIIHLIAIPVVVGILIYKLLKGGSLLFLYRIFQYICLLYIIFMLMWGLNYSRISIAEITGLKLEPYSVEQLYELNLALIERGNSLRGAILEDEHGVMHIQGGYRDVFSRAKEGYFIAGKDIKAFAGNYGKPKAIILSKPMLYTGITGMYFPFTAEVNVNVAVPDLLLPATVLHEMAHQRGFASEDEANYIAYLTASVHPDIDFQYSGIILALLNSMNALHRQSPLLAAQLRDAYSSELSRDLMAYSEFWRDYEGPINETANRVNDTYLKSNGQKEGIQSYGRMVDLLLAHYLTYGEI